MQRERIYKEVILDGCSGKTEESQRRSLYEVAYMNDKTGLQNNTASIKKKLMSDVPLQQEKYKVKYLKRFFST